MSEGTSERVPEVRPDKESVAPSSDVAAGYRERLRAGRAGSETREDLAMRKGEGSREGTADAERPEWRGDIEEGGEPLAEFPAIEQRLRQSVERAREGVQRWGPQDEARAETWFGSSGPEVRQHVSDVLERMDAEIDRVRLMPFEDGEDPAEMAETFAYVYPGDQERRVYVGVLFRDASEAPPDSQAGILVHEMSHFSDIGATRDVKAAYGREGSRQLALSHPELARRTADNFEYFVEEYSPRENTR